MGVVPLVVCVHFPPLWGCVERVRSPALPWTWVCESGLSAERPTLLWVSGSHQHDLDFVLQMAFYQTGSLKQLYFIASEEDISLNESRSSGPVQK